MKPILQAILVADHVYQDRASGKMIVVGIFSTLHIFKHADPNAQIPSDSTNFKETGERKLQPHEISRVGSPYCYVNLTSVRGTLPLELRYVDLSDNSILMRLQISVTSSDPLKNNEFAVILPPLPILHPGCYTMELLFNNELLGSHRITAQEIASADEKGEQ
jgi:hypothetical protein